LQWWALRRFWGAVRRPSGWKPGDVSFSPDDFSPIPSEHVDLHALTHEVVGERA